MEEDKLILRQNIQNTLLEIENNIEKRKKSISINFAGIVLMDTLSKFPLYGVQYLFAGVLGILSMELLYGIPEKIKFLEEEYQYLLDLNDKIETTEYTDLNNDYQESLSYLQNSL